MRQLPLSTRLGCILLVSIWLCSTEVWGQTRQEKEREKVGLRQQFKKNFSDLQVISQRLFNSHRAGTLTANQLAKDAKAINKSAKTLETLMALGNLVEEKPMPVTQPSQATEFDQCIRGLAEAVYTFSHSPHHQNHRVFDLVEAAKVQRELARVIQLSKTLEMQSKYYTALGK